MVPATAIMSRKVLDFARLSSKLLLLITTSQFEGVPGRFIHPDKPTVRNAGRAVVMVR